MIGFNVVRIWCGFAEKGGCEGVMAACVRVAVQRAVRAAATLGWRMAGAWQALARAKLLMKAAAASWLHLPPTSIASTTKRQRWLLRSSGLLSYVSLSLSIGLGSLWDGLYSRLLRHSAKKPHGNITKWRLYEKPPACTSAWQRSHSDAQSATARFGHM